MKEFSRVSTQVRMAPVKSCSRPAGSSMTRGTSGAFGFPTDRSQPPVTTKATSAAARADSRGMEIFRCRFMAVSSESELDTAGERPELRILEPIHPHLERIAVEPGDLRIEAAVVGDREQVAGDEREPHFANAVEQPDTPQLLGTERVADRQFLQLGVRAALDEIIVGIETVIES